GCVRASRQIAAEVAVVSLLEPVARFEVLGEDHPAAALDLGELVADEAGKVAGDRGPELDHRSRLERADRRGEPRLVFRAEPGAAADPQLDVGFAEPPGDV